MELATLAIGVDSRPVKTAAEDLDRLAATGARTEKAMQGVGRGGQAAGSGSNEAARGSRAATDAMKRQTEAAAALTNMVRRYALAVVGAFSAGAIAGQVRSMTELASRYNELGIVMTTVGRNAGFTRGELAQLEIDLKKTGISALESRSNIAKLIAANIDLSKATQLARLAQDAAVIGGLNSSEAFARLTAGIQSAQVEVLRTMGLNANFQASYEALAKTLNKNAEDLTELEKVQARTNSVLSLAPTIAGAYEASMTNAGKAMRSTQRYAEDLQVAVGQAFQPAYEAAVATYTSALKLAAENVDFLQRAMTALSVSGITLVSGGLLMLAQRALPAVITQMNALTVAMMRNPFGLLAVGISTVISALVLFDDETTSTRTSLEKLGDVWGEIYRDIKGVAGGLRKEVSDLWGEIQGLTGDPSPKSWTDMLIVGLARVADVAATVVRGIGTLAAGINTLITSGQALVAFAGRPDALTKAWAPEEAERLEKEYQDRLNASLEAQKQFGKQLSDLWDHQGNKYEQAALRAINAIKVVTEHVELVDLTLQQSADNQDNASKKGQTAYQSLIASIRAKIEENKLEIAVGEKATAADRIRIKVEQDLAAGRLKLSAAQKSVVDQALRALATSEKELNIARMLQAADKKQIDMSVQAVKTATDEVRKNAELVQTYGMKASAIELLTVARLEDQLAQREALKLTEDQIMALELMIAARKENAQMLGNLEWLEEQKRVWGEWQSALDQVFQQVGQSLTDRLFEGGRSARELIKDLFKTLVLRVAVQPVMMALQGSVQGMLGNMLGVDPRVMAASNPGSNMLGLAQNANTAYQAYSGGMASNMGQGIQWIGEKIGSQALQSFATGLTGAAGAAGTVAGITSVGAGLGASLGTSIGTSTAAMASTSFSAALSGGAGASMAATAGASGAAGAGAALGAALPWIGGALAIGSLLGGGLFDREPTTRREQRTQVEYGGGIFDITKTDDRAPAGADAAARALAEQAVATANDIFKQVGIDAAIDSFHAIMASSYQGDRDGVASGGRLRIGDEYRDIGIDLNDPNPTIKGFGGWSSAETLPRLATDIQLSILEAFQSAGVMSSILEGIDIRGLGEEAAAQLAASVQQIVSETAAFQEAIVSLPFANLRDLSFDAAANLVQFAGGLENLNAGLTVYLQEFFSEEEKVALATQNLTREFSALGLALPDVSQGGEAAKAAFRDIADSIDVTTEEGARLYASLINLAGPFSQLTSAADQLAASTARAAEERQKALDDAYKTALGDVTSAYNAVVQAGQREIAALQQSFSATDTAMSSYRSAVQRLETEFNSLFSAIDQGVNALRGQVSATARMQYDQARAVISTTLLTGQLPQTADLTDAIRAAQQGVMGQRYSSLFEQQRAYLQLANEIEALQAIAEPELDAAKATLEQLENQYRLLRGMSLVGEDSLKSLEAQLRVALSTEEAARRQIATIEAQIDAARQMHDELVGVLTDGFMTLTDALASFESAVSAAIAAASARAGGGGGGGSGGSSYPTGYAPNSIAPGSPYDRASAYYKANPDVASAWNAGTGMTYDQFAAWHYDNYGKSEGRSYDVGTSYVPYDMRANIHKGEIIIDPRSSDILRRYGIGVQGGGTSRETEQLLREQLSEVRQQNRYLYEIVKSGKRTANNTEDTATAIAHGDSDGVVVVM